MKTGIEYAADYSSIIAGKTILVTGVSPGTLGSTFIKAAAKHKPALLILAGRNTEKLQRTIDELKQDNLDASVAVQTLQLDLSSLSAVRQAAAKVNSWEDVPHIDVLINNAGIMAVDYAVTVDGFESQFGTNHLGHFLFTNLILDKVLAAPAPRVVSVSSDGHCLCPIRFADYNFHGGETYNRWRAYGQSKTANILMALSLAQKLGKSKNLLAFSLHPGAIMTHLGDHLHWETAYPELLEAYKIFGHSEGWRESFPLVSFEEGVATHFVAAFDPNITDHNGAYLEKGELADAWSGRIKPWATDAIEAERLWRLSEELVGQKFQY